MKISEVNKQRIELYGITFLILLIIAVAVNLYKANAIVKYGISLTSESAVEALEHPASFDSSILSGYTREKSFSSAEITDWLKEGRTVLVSTDSETETLYLIYGAEESGFLAIDASGAQVELSENYRICYVENKT